MGGTAWGGELVVVAVDQGAKNRLERESGRWSPLLALKLPPVGTRVEISGRTEFHAFFLDPQGSLLHRPITFVWRLGDGGKAYGPPVAVRVMPRKGHAHPLAYHHIWSDPSLMGGMLSGLGLSSTMSRARWRSSSCYGPRQVRVLGPDGRVLAQKNFDILPRGVTVY